VLFVVATLLSLVALALTITDKIPQVQAAAGINRTINFQGKIVDDNGLNIADGTYDVEFKVYSVSSAGTALWTETRTSGDQITVTDGVFRVALGEVTAISTSIDFNSDSLYLGINFDGDGEMTPRLRMTSVPYALNAEKVSGLTVTNTTGSLTIPDATDVVISGAYDLTLTTSATTNVTLPTTGTLATLAGTETFTNKTIGSTGLVFSGATNDITTATDEHFAIMPAGTGAVGIGIATPNGDLEIRDSSSFSSSTNSFVINHPNTPSVQNSGESFRVRSDASVKISDRYGDNLDVGLHVNYVNKAVNAYFGRNYSNLASTGLAVANNATGTYDFTGSIYSGITTGVINTNNNVRAGLSVVSRYDNDNYTASNLGKTYGIYALSKNTSTVQTNGIAKRWFGGYFSAEPSFPTSNTNAIAIGIEAAASGAEFNYAALFTAGNVGIGTATPTYLLDVNGTGRFTGAVDLDGDVEFNSTITDINGSVGTSGQVLSSTTTGVDWIDAGAGSDDQTLAEVLTQGNSAGSTAIDMNNQLITNIGNASTDFTSGGGLTLAATLTASNGLTLTTGALSLTATSGALGLSGLSASSISTGANALTVTSSNFNTTATGINTTPIGATTPSTGAFTTLSSTGATTLGNNSANVAVNSDVWDITGAGAITGLTALTSSGTITFSSLTPDRLVSTTTGGALTNSISSANAALSISDETGSGLIVFNNAPTFTTGSVNFSGITSDIITPTDEHLAIMPAGTGKVGIGITGPSEKLHVDGNIRVDGNILGNSLDRPTAGALTIGNATATSVSICNSTACDTITIGTNADADTIGIGDSLDGLTIASTAFNVNSSGAVSGVTTMSTSGDWTWTATTPTITINSSETFTVVSGTDNFTVNTSGSSFGFSDGTNGITFDADTGPLYTGTARPAKKITISPEYAGGTLSLFYGAGTESSYVGSMTADVETTATHDLRTFYSWTSAEAALNSYVVALRITLPADFGGWATSNAVQINFTTNSTSNANNALDTHLYLSSNSTTAISSTTNNVAGTGNTWQAVTIDDSTLDDDSAPEWDDAGETAVIYLRMRSRSSNTVKLGDIVLNYLAKF
jgi:hypothetical protein